METQAHDNLNTDSDSTVDASRPFRSVKEAVAIFGERFLSPPRFSPDRETSSSPVAPQSPNKPFNSEIHSSLKPVASDKQTSDSFVILQFPNKPPISETPSSPGPSRFALEKQACDSSLLVQSPNKSPSNAGKQVVDTFVREPTPSPRKPEDEKHGNIVHGNDLVMMLMVLKKLESELQDTKMELKLLKERESETEIALASLNAELHKNMSKIAKVEAAEAAKAAATMKLTMSPEGGKRDMGTTDGEKARGDVIVKNLDSPTLAQILSISDYEGYIRDSKKASNMLIKKKPIVPLVTDIFPWKKRSSPSNDPLSPLFSSHKYSA